jgi:type VI secretion system protein ImpE
VTPNALLDAGRLTDAIQALDTEVRDHPTDKQRRTFLFELLCFAGRYDRAEKQLDVLAQASHEAASGALFYRAALHAERLRDDLFSAGEFWKKQSENPVHETPAGLLNGKAFVTLSDSDPRIGRRLEVFAAGAYLWIPFEHIVSIDVSPPRRLRDLLWATAHVQTTPAFQQADLGEVLLPVLAPLTSKHSSDAVKLGRETLWSDSESGSVVPSGQKTFMMDEEEIPFLEVRRIEFQGEPG